MQPAIAVFTPADHRGAAAVIATGGVAEIKQSIAGEIRMQGDVEQATLTPGSNGGQASDGLSIEFAVNNPAQAPGSFGNQHFTFRQERHGPGVFKAADHGVDVDDHRLFGCHGGRRGDMLILVAGGEQQ